MDSALASLCWAPHRSNQPTILLKADKFIAVNDKKFYHSRRHVQRVSALGFKYIIFKYVIFKTQIKMHIYWIWKPSQTTQVIKFYVAMKI
jgi:hypothetical protein